MTIELVDGKAGTNHISSEDKSIIHQAKFGRGSMVFDWGDALKCTMKTANQAVIGTGCASIQGLDWHITDPETVTIDTGSQGMNRNDIVAAHYHRDSAKNDIETIGLEVLNGTPTSGTAADPTIPTGVILNGATDAYQALWRIPLTGITVGTPVRLFTPKSGLWDSVTQTLITSQFGTVTGVKTGNVAQINVTWKSANTASWGTGNFGIIPEGWRPVADVRGTWSGRDGGSQREFLLKTNGTFTYNNRGGSQSGDFFATTMTYIVA